MLTKEINLYDMLQVAESEEDRLTEEERLLAAVKPLLAWYRTHARILPWREDPAPYRVWISEIMLQQTRVEAVKPYFERFLTALPDIGALAEVGEDRLMVLWQGLGYYNRARNLKKAAQVIMEEHGGEMPADEAKLRSLPGIGSYTAGAIASIAFGIPAPAVDGNVLRVLSRVLASEDDILKQTTKNRMETLVRSIMPKDEAGSFNQALIEIGAIVCVPNGEPHCSECPLESLCLAKRENRISELPVKTPPKKRKIEKRTVVILENGRELALKKRGPEGLLASLYELPNAEGELTEAELSDAFFPDRERIVRVERLKNAKHIFSHIEWHMTGYRILVEGELPEEYIRADRENFAQLYALPNAFAAYTKLIGTPRAVDSGAGDEKSCG